MKIKNWGNPEYFFDYFNDGYEVCYCGVIPWWSGSHHLIICWRYEP